MVDNVNTGVALLLPDYSATGVASQTPGLEAEVLEPQDPKTFWKVVFKDNKLHKCPWNLQLSRLLPGRGQNPCNLCGEKPKLQPDNILQPGRTCARFKPSVSYYT